MKKKHLRIYYLIFISLFSFNKNVFAASNFDCESFGALRNDLKNFFDFFKIIVPLLVIGLSTYDFIKAISQKDDKDVKKAFSRLLKRIICAIILFFLPVILDLVLNLVTDTVCIEEVVM